MKNENLKGYLLETYYCDYSHDSIQKIARGFMERYKDQNELAKKLFYFVRDNTRYTVGNWNKRASYTLKFGYGTCTNNANLLVALLRACDVPAGYGVMEVIGPDYFGEIVPPRLSRTVSKKSKHVYCYVYLNEIWIKCDPSDDEPLSINTQHLNPQSNIVEWNGISDAVLNLLPSHILSDSGPINNIDYIINKRQRMSMYIPVRIGNFYIDFLRKKGMEIKTIEEMENKFEDWLKTRHYFDYLLLELFFIFYDIIKGKGINKEKVHVRNI